MAFDIKKLKAVKMPAKPAAEAEASHDLDLESYGSDAGEGSDAEEASESPAKEASEGASDLADISDDDLIKEIMSRGLATEVEKADSQSGSDDDSSSMPTMASKPSMGA